MRRSSIGARKDVTQSAGTSKVLRLLMERYEDPRVRGKKFERVMQRAFMEHPDVYGKERFKHVWRWMEWPDRHSYGYGTDIGIDLVGELTDAYGGGLCAIQTKAHTGSIDKKAVDSFISASSGRAFASRLLAVTGPVNAHARSMIFEARPRCEVLYGSDLDGWPVNWDECVDEPESLRFTPRSRYTPKQFQSDAVNKVVEGFRSQDRGRLVLPCGTGKSVVSLWIAERVASRGGRVLFLVPSIALMNQTMREWAQQRNPNVPHRYIGVCSDVKAGYVAEDAPLVELAMPVTTDPARIAHMLNEDYPNEMLVVFSTYQSIDLIARSLAASSAWFDLVVCDEAHRTTGIEGANTNGKSAGGVSTDGVNTTRVNAGGENTQFDAAILEQVSPFLLVHNPVAIKARKRLYMTATPRIYTDAVKSKLAKARDTFDVFSMDDEETYGPELYRMSFGDAVEGKHLTDYKVLVIAVAEDPVLDAYDNIMVDSKDKRSFKIQQAVHFAGCWDGLADPTTMSVKGRVTGTINSKTHAKRAIAFTNRISNSQIVERYWSPVVEAMSSATRNASGDESVSLLQCETRHVDGSKNALERADTLAWLREGSDDDGVCRIVSNARCLTEGIDVPALDAVIFLEPKQSQVDVIQAVGRVMRKSENKEVGYVILPVVVPSDASLTDDAVLSGSDFKSVWKVLKALRSHDERLDVKINTADLTGRMPITLLTSGLCETCGRAVKQCECADSSSNDSTAAGEVLQQRLPFHHAVSSRLVKMCGDRQYWDRWGREVARITQIVAAHARAAVERNVGLATQFERFADAMQATVGGSIASGDLATMLAQHVVTMPVFEALFAGSGFAERNPISRALNEILEDFQTHNVNLSSEISGLERFYRSVRNRLSGAENSDARISVMLEVYESFFKEAMPEEVSRLGIVYTPVEIVDFIVRSADAVCREEFGSGLTAENVHILDPFTGTGTFINRLLTQNNSEGQPFIQDTDLDRKFINTWSPVTPGGTPNELHANEVVLLAYYLAALKIEEGYRDRTGRYEPFSGIVLTDTLQQDPSKLPGTGAMRYNSERARLQGGLSIRVVVGNPPWSAGQKSAGDDNPNVEYRELEGRVRDTYGFRHREVTGRSGGGNSAGNLYVQSLRWASDRLNNPSGDSDGVGGDGGGVDVGGDVGGVVAMVHPNSLLNATSLAGMRACLRDEFTGIYVVNLLGDAMKSGEERRREGQEVFGQGSRSGVQITVLVRNPGRDLSEPAVLRYAAVPEYSSVDEKFKWLQALGDVTSSKLKVVPLNKEHHWVNLTDGTFNNLLPVCETKITTKHNNKNETGGVLVTEHASGVKTNCDVYVYSFSREQLREKILRLIDAYNRARREFTGGVKFSEVTRNDNLAAIKWTATLKHSLKQGLDITYDEGCIREVLYRPFTKLWLYEDDRIVSSIRTISKMFPQPNQITPPPPKTNTKIFHNQTKSPPPPRNRELAICVASPCNMAVFGTLATNTICDLKATGTNQPTRTIPKQKRS